MFKNGQKIEFIGSDAGGEYLSCGTSLHGMKGRICLVESNAKNTVELRVKWFDFDDDVESYIYQKSDLKVLEEPKEFKIGDKVKFTSNYHYHWGEKLLNTIGTILFVDMEDEDALQDCDGDTVSAMIQWEGNEFNTYTPEDIKSGRYHYFYNPDELEIINKVAVNNPRKTWYSTEGQKGLWDLVREQDEREALLNAIKKE